MERENSISCETQIEYAKSIIKPDERKEEVITFVDNGFSGGNINRTGFQQMLQMIRQGQIRKVIVYRLDRISRSLIDFVNMLQEFKQHNVEFVSSQEAFDTSSTYGELIIKILMVFAEFERNSTIERVRQAYQHRSDMGFYMGGRRPYGFELVPAVIHDIKTKKLSPIAAEAAQIQYIFEAYAQERVSLRRLRDMLIAENKTPLDGSAWSTAKLSALLKNPIYVKADFNVYDYFERHGVQMITDSARFTGEYGAQLYGRARHNPQSPDWSDMKLVLLSHAGIVDSAIWLQCQRKLERNKQIGNSYNNPTSWLAGKVVCQKCGHTMTTIKGKANKAGEVRRYFNCTGKSHKKICTGPKEPVYAADLENLVADCIAKKLQNLQAAKLPARRGENAEANAIKLQIKAIEQEENKLLDHMLSKNFNEALLALANQKAAQLQRSRQALSARLEDLQKRSVDEEGGVDLAKAWQTADYSCQKEVAMLMLHKISVSEEGNVNIAWRV